jgi:hypothetical protein
MRMAKRKRTSSPDLTAGQAQYVVRRILSERRVPASLIRQYLGELDTEIATLEQQLEMLRAASGEGGSRGGSGGRTRGGDSGSAGGHRRRRNLSPERRESLRLQGHYLALIRQIPARKRAQYKAIVEKSGKEAAIAALRRAVGK